MKSIQKASGRINLLRKMKPLLHSNTTGLIYNAMILPILTYCPFTTFDTISSGLKGKIKSLENRAQRIVGNVSKVPSSEKIKRIRVESYVHRCINQNSVCKNFENYFQTNDTSIKTRNNGIMVRLPKVRLESTRDSFYFKGPLLFNKLPREIRLEKGSNKLKKLLNQL